jgi:hypothetical protein
MWPISRKIIPNTKIHEAFSTLTVIPTAPKVYWFPTGCVPDVPTFIWLIDNMAAEQTSISSHRLLWTDQTIYIAVSFTDMLEKFKVIFSILISRRFLLGCPRNNKYFFRVEPKLNLFRLFFGLFRKTKKHFFWFVSVFRTCIETTETNRTLSKQTKKISKKCSLLGGPRNS